MKLKLHLLVLIINNFIFYQIKTEPFLSIFNSSNCLCKQQNLLELSINELLTITKSRRLSQISPKFSIEQFEFVGNTVFSDEYLTKLVEEFTKQDITFSQLLQVEAKINANYLQAGYINSFAVIPANQNIQNRVVKIQIIEGGIEDIRVTGTQRLAKEYIINRLKIVDYFSRFLMFQNHGKVENIIFKTKADFNVFKRSKTEYFFVNFFQKVNKLTLRILTFFQKTTKFTKISPFIFDF